MKKVIMSIMFILLTTILIIVYTSKKILKDPPKLEITIGDKKIEYITSRNQWDGTAYDRLCAFKTIMKEGSNSEIPYIEIGKTAMISFKNNPPSKFTISDILIDENGKQMYFDKVINNIPVELSDGKCSFGIKKHFASALSSVYVKNKIDYSGFKMIASWGENECEYAFIIRTDGF